MTKILLIRHGHVEGISPKRFRGRSPLALTARGRAEAEAVARRVFVAWRPGQIYTSPMQRCVETAEAIRRACGSEKPVIIEGLNDIDYGDWQFLSYEDASVANPGLFATWFSRPHLVRFPNGESLQDLVLRTADALRFAVTRHPDETIVLVGHDSGNRALLLQLLEQPLSAYWRIAQDPCCINEIDIVAGAACIRRINETAHLDA